MLLLLNIYKIKVILLKKKQHQKGISGEIKWSHERNISAWQQLQYGMFIHWGLYSKLGGEWKGTPVTEGYSEQIQMWANISDEEYREIASEFTAENFDPKEICSLAKSAGMKYIVITSKHHDGFSLFDTKTTDYNAVQSTPFAQDAIKLLADECKKQGLEFGLYYSLVDWHQGHEFDPQNSNPIPANIEIIIEEQLRELLTNYGPIAEVWFDMSSPTVAQSHKFAKIVQDLQPNVGINGRIWNNTGDFRTLNDNQIPSLTLDGAWQTPASIYQETWGYRTWQVRDDFDGKVRNLTIALVRVIARGGNFLLNIGPRGDGSIVEFEADVLKSIGEWLHRHPDAVLGAKATKFAEQPWGEITVNKKSLFLHIINWPENGQITLPGLVTGVTSVQEDDHRLLDWEINENNLTITLPDEPKDDLLPVIRVEMADELFVIPEKIVASDRDGNWFLDHDDFYTGYGYADEGHYFSLVQTNVRQTAYIVNTQAKAVQVNVKGMANPNKNYRVQLGNETQVVTGSKLTRQSVGSFDVSNLDNVVLFQITLDDAEHSNEELDLNLQSVQIEQI